MGNVSTAKEGIRKKVKSKSGQVKVKSIFGCE